MQQQQQNVAARAPMDPKVAVEVEKYRDLQTRRFKIFFLNSFFRTTFDETTKRQTTGMNEMITSKQNLITRLNENTLVKKELDILEDDTPVFKLVGAVLVKNDLGDAKANVSQRLKYIESDIKRMDNKLDKMKKDHTELGEKLVKLQQEAAAKASEKK